MNKTRQAYEVLLKAVENKSKKTKTPRNQIVQTDNSAHYIRTLQDLAVYLGVIN